MPNYYERIEIGATVEIEGVSTYYLGKGFYYDPANACVRTAGGAVTAKLLNLAHPPAQRKALNRWAKSILLLANVQTVLSVGMSAIGSITSEAKARASAANGRLGGRPRLNRPKSE